MPPSVAIDRSRGALAWWVHTFGSHYLSVYGHRDEDEARRNAPAIARWLGLRPQQRILDLACGEGRYARAFGQLGYRVTGVDYSETLLDEARGRSPMLPGSPSYVRCDMRELPYHQQFDAVVSLFTSFGYFDDRADDAKVLAGVARALVPGGRYLLDFLNASEVRSRLVPESEQVRGDYRVFHRRRIDEESADGPYVRKASRVTDARTGEVLADLEERVRLYEPEELDAAMRTVGLVPRGAAYGDFDGRPHGPDTPRWIRIAERAGDGPRSG